MGIQIKARILVVTNDPDMGTKFVSLLKSKKYASKLCVDLREILAVIKNYRPHLVFWLFPSDIPEEIPDAMLQIQRNCSKDEHPFNFLAYPKDSFDPRFEFLANAFVVSPFHVGDALGTIESLLKKKLS